MVTKNKLRWGEGTYSIILDTDTGTLEYSVGNFGVIWDCQKNKRLKYNLSADIYMYLAIQKLDEIMLNEEDSEDYGRFSEERFFDYLE